MQCVYGHIRPVKQRSVHDTRTENTGIQRIQRYPYTILVQRIIYFDYLKFCIDNACVGILFQSLLQLAHSTLAFDSSFICLAHQEARPCIHGTLNALRKGATT